MGWNGLSGIDFSRKAEPREREAPERQDGPLPRPVERAPEARQEERPVHRAVAREERRDRPSIRVPDAEAAPDMEKEA